MPSRGILIDTNDVLISPKIKAMIFWGLYERTEARFITKHLRRDLDVVELGSSLGIISCLIRKTLNCDRLLICVEAHPGLPAIIERNLQLNSLHLNTRVINAAITYDAAPGERVSLLEADDTLGTQVSRSSTNGLESTAMTLSQVISENSIETFALVCDIEGAEAGILDCDSRALENCKQMVIELHDTTFNGKRAMVSDMMETLVQEHGFFLAAQHGAVCVFER